MMAPRVIDSRLLSRAAVAAAVWTVPHWAGAAPFLNASLVGRLSGSGNAFSSTVQVSTGQSVDYQMIYDVAPTGTVNVQGAATRTITSLVFGTDGVNAHKHDIFELASDDIQVNFTAPGTLNPDPTALAGDSWAGGSGAGGGTPTLNPGRGLNDLIAIRPIHVAGVQTGIDPEVVMDGMFTVYNAPMFANASLLRMRFSTTSPSGSMRINGGATVLFTLSAETGPDPLTGYTPLTLVVPEPGAVSLLALASLSLLKRRID
jgi:hypothetical protein